MQGEETKHPVVDRLKPINRTSEVTEGFLRGETGVTSAVPEPPYTMNELMGEMEEVTRETLAEKTHEPSPTPTSATKPVVKKITITCTKGKVVKKVTGTAPKCPAGYKKK